MIDTHRESLCSVILESGNSKLGFVHCLEPPKDNEEKKCNSNYSKIIMLQEKQALFGW